MLVYGLETLPVLFCVAANCCFFCLFCNTEIIPEATILVIHLLPNGSSYILSVHVDSFLNAFLCIAFLWIKFNSFESHSMSLSLPGKLWHLSPHGYPAMSPIALLTRVSCGGFAAHILSAQVGPSLVNKQPRKQQHLSPPTSDSERNQDMTLAWNSRWATSSEKKNKKKTLWRVTETTVGLQSEQQTSAAETLGQTFVNRSKKVPVIRLSSPTLLGLAR